MEPMDPVAPRWSPKPRTVLVGFALSLTVLVVLSPGTARAAWEEIARIVGLRGEPLPASPAVFSDHEAGEVPGLSPQEQVLRLLPRAANHYQGAIEQIESHVEAWAGNVQYTDELSGMLRSAMDSNDLRVRAAAIEIYLAAWNVPKTAEAVDTYIDRARNVREEIPTALWVLGLLGSRGVETERVKDTLLPYLRDPDEQARFWAVEGLALVATDDLIEPLLVIFHDDPSPAVRERAACSLAQSGMFETAQRMRAVPVLLNWMDEPGLDGTTRDYVFHALRDITGVSHGTDPAAWRAWWNESR